jgi:hypothetical protein
VTVTLKDRSGVPVAGKVVTLTAVGWPPRVEPTISPTSATTGSNGVATFTVKGRTLGSGAFQAEDMTDSVTLSNQAKVSFLSPQDPDVAESSVAASPTSVPADGKTEATVTVTLVNIADKPIAGLHVYLYQSGPGHKSLSGTALTRISSFPDETPTVGLTTSNSSGVATFSVGFRHFRPSRDRRLHGRGGLGRAGRLGLGSERAAHQDDRHGNGELHHRLRRTGGEQATAKAARRRRRCHHDGASLTSTPATSSCGHRHRPGSLREGVVPGGELAYPAPDQFAD